VLQLFKYRALRWPNSFVCTYFHGQTHAERSEQIHECSQVHYVQFENVSLFCICKFQFAPKAFDISWQCIVKFPWRWKTSKWIFYQIKGIYKCTILMHAISIPYLEEFRPSKDVPYLMMPCNSTGTSLLLSEHYNLHRMCRAE